MSGKSHKRPKSFYLNCSKRRKYTDGIQVGKKGFFLTCNGREEDCSKEANNLLSEYADRLYGPTEVSEEQPLDVDDIEEAIRKEIDNLKNASPAASRFKIVDTGVKNCLFIETNLPDPCHLVHTIMTDVLASQKQRARFICRLMPVMIVCKAHMEDIEKATASLLEQHFKGTESEGKSFAIIFRSRYNDSIKRDVLIPALATKIQDLNSLNKANLSDPNLAVVVEVLLKYCMISVLPDYYQLKKYNLFELINKPKAAVSKGVGPVNPDKVSKNEASIEKQSAKPSVDSKLSEKVESDNKINIKNQSELVDTKASDTEICEKVSIKEELVEKSDIVNQSDLVDSKTSVTEICEK